MKKKVFFISAANNIHTIRWVNALCEDYEIHLIYCKDHSVSINKPNEKVILHELKYKSPIGYYLNALQLRKLYDEIKPDIINVHYASGYATLARISKIKPILLSIWGSDVYDFPNKSRINKRIFIKNIQNSYAIASTSNVMAKELERQVPNHGKTVYITPFGVDINRFRKISTVKTNKNLNIGLVKTLEKKYGIEYAILAIKMLKERLLLNNEEELAKSIRFLIYGDGRDKQKIVNLINMNFLNDTVFLKGRIANDEVPNVLSTFDVFCATSILDSESFGVAVVEAMSCEIPVIVTDVDGFKEVVENNISGLIVKRKNVEEISYALESLLKDKKLRSELSKNGRDRVIKYYDWNNNVISMKSAYAKIINNYSEDKNG